MALDMWIVDACEAVWEQEFHAGFKNSNNCSGFVKAVAKKLGVPFLQVGRADDIGDYLAKSAEWTLLATTREAASKATAGAFVVASLKSDQHSPKRSEGHVAIVVTGPLYRDKYPRCWGGSTGLAQSKGNKSTGEIWNTKDRDNVKYYGYNTVSYATS